MGGDSLGVVELLAGMRERFGVDVTASTVLDAPTVGQLAAWLDAPRHAHRRRPGAPHLVGLRVGTGGRTLFCATGGGDPAVSLRALSDVLATHDFYAMQARGLEERALPDRSIEGMASRNIEAMRAVQPHGPYALGGYSFGGLVAFEMACQLRKVGDAVDLLVELDTVAPGNLGGLARRARKRSEQLRAGAPDGGLARVAVVGARSARFAARSAYAHAQRRLVIASVGVIPRRGLAQYDAFYRLHALMARKYRPSSTCDAPVLVVRTGEGAGDLGWSTLTSRRVTVVDVHADHLDLLRAPAVNQVGRYVSDALS